MANFTKNLKLEKPLQTENYNVDIFNANSDKIDGIIDLLNSEINEIIPKLGDRRIVFTANGTYTASEDCVVTLSAVAGGGGGSSSTGCGGGSGQSIKNKVINLKKNESINITIGTGGKGNTYTRSNSVLPQGGECNGENGTNTIITINTAIGAETITLIAGKGASIGTKIFDYNGGEGEHHGQLLSINTWDSTTEDTWWIGGAGGNSIFGSGGMGGSINPVGKSVNATNATSAGAGGGGGGIRRHGSSDLYTWNNAGDGCKGEVIIYLK